MSSSSGGTGISLASLLQASQVITGNHHVTGSEQQVTGNATQVQVVTENDVNMAENEAEVSYDRKAVKDKWSFTSLSKSKMVTLSLFDFVQ